MEDRPPLHPDNKVYTLTPKFITDIISYYRKLKLKRYKHRKIKQSKTSFDRNYFVRFKIRIEDEINPQVSNLIYEMVIPAKAAYFAKLFLERDIKNKLSVDIVDWEEMKDEELEVYNRTKDRYMEARK
jgi:hypothetical protein